MRIEFAPENLPEIEAALGAFGRALRRRVGRALDAGAEVLRDGIRGRMPRDSGVAASAVEVTAARDADGVISLAVGFDAEAVRAKAPNGEFYAAIIEFGSDELNRPPVAPVRRTLDEDGDRARREVLAQLGRIARDQARQLGG